jgi:uncharacterized damage-inducible protein DinB
LLWQICSNCCIIALPTTNQIEAEMKRYALSIAAMMIAVPAFGQSTGVEAARSSWQGLSAYITKAADQMTEADYAYKPTEKVRTFGQLIGHVAGSQLMFCAAALGEAPKGEGDIEKSVTTKAGLVAALKQSNDYCARAYAMTDAQAAGKAKLFDQDQTKMAIIMSNATHIGEHYGNIVTYMRMKGMVPPSSQPQTGM